MTPSACITVHLSILLSWPQVNPLMLLVCKHFSRRRRDLVKQARFQKRLSQSLGGRCKNGAKAERQLYGPSALARGILEPYLPQLMQK